MVCECSAHVYSSYYGKMPQTRQFINKWKQFFYVLRAESQDQDSSKDEAW